MAEAEGTEGSLQHKAEGRAQEKGKIHVGLLLTVKEADWPLDRNFSLYGLGDTPPQGFCSTARLLLPAFSKCHVH